VKPDEPKDDATLPASPPSHRSEPVRVIGRYALYEEIASGGMATVHFGRLLGPVGFARTVAIKRLHVQYAKDPEFVSMFLDEARLAARIRHPNVVQTLDVVATNQELFLVMDYVQGEALWRLFRATKAGGAWVPPRIVTAIMAGALFGLHAAHEARGERGETLGIVHRDVSPQNILVGVDGSARVLDFGVAKASGRIHSTQGGALKGKLAYMAPEQLGGEVSRRTDVFAASIVLWEALTSHRLFSGADERETVGKVLSREIPRPSGLMGDLRKLPPEVRAGLPALDQVVLKGLMRDPNRRFATAREMGIALEKSIGVASPAEVGEWVEYTARDVLSARTEAIASIESSSSKQTSFDPEEIRDQLRASFEAEGPPPDVPPARISGRSLPSASGGSLPNADDGPSSKLSKISLSRSEYSDQLHSNRGRWMILFAAAALGGGVVAAGTFLWRPSSLTAASPAPVSTSSAPSASSPSPSDGVDATTAGEPARATPSASQSLPAISSSAAAHPKQPAAIAPVKSAPPKGNGNIDSLIDTRK
jgi:serine/threonine protein kinase